MQVYTFNHIDENQEFFCFLFVCLVAWLVAWLFFLFEGQKKEEKMLIKH